MLSKDISSKTTKKDSIQNDRNSNALVTRAAIFLFFFYPKGRRQWYLIIIPENNDSADFKGSIILLSGNDEIITSALLEVNSGSEIGNTWCEWFWIVMALVFVY